MASQIRRSPVTQYGKRSMVKDWSQMSYKDHTYPSTAMAILNESISTVKVSRTHQRETADGGNKTLIIEIFFFFFCSQHSDFLSLSPSVSFFLLFFPPSFFPPSFFTSLLPSFPPWLLFYFLLPTSLFSSSSSSFLLARYWIIMQTHETNCLVPILNCLNQQIELVLIFKKLSLSHSSILH